MFASLPPPPRRYLPPGVDVARIDAAEACYGELAARPLPEGDLWALEQWLRDWSELESHLAEEQARRQIAMTRRTDDEGAERAHLEFVEVIAPRCKPLRDALARRLVDHPAAARLDPARYGCALQVLRNHVALFAPAAIPLEAEEQRLCAEYQKLRAALRVEFEGEARAVETVEQREEDPDRDRREAAWRAVTDAFLAAAADFDALFTRMLDNRLAQAAAAGFADYRAYRFRRLDRFAYGPDDCLAFHDAIEAEVVPLASALLERRRAALGLAAVRPWDLLAPQGGAPLRPFQREEELVAGCARAFEAVDPAFGRDFAGLAGHGLLDLMARPGKAPGGYQSNLEASARPFLFTNAVGRHEDVLTLLHEGGHAFHALACADDPLIWNRNPPMEFCEVASMAMELMGSAHLGAFYPDPADIDRALRLQLEGIALFLPYMAAIDGFQHWVYTHAGAARDPDARAAAWLALHRRMVPAVDWSGLDAARAALWQRKLHVFELPFYYVEYGIAQLGALQVYRRYRRDPADAVARYRHALSLGARAPLPALFAAAGLRFDLGRPAVRELMDFVADLLAA